MRTIYNTYVVMQDQTQCDRMKQLCIDNGLKVWKEYRAFHFSNIYKNIFHYSFVITNAFSVAWYSKIEIKGFTQITEQEFIELLKTTKL